MPHLTLPTIDYKKSSTLFIGVVSAFVLNACGGSSDSASNPTVNNTAPVVSAGEDQSVDEGVFVNVQADVTDTEGDATLLWSQRAGPRVQLSSRSTAEIQFRAPQIRGDATVVLRLTASDGAFSSSDDISIVINDTGRGTLSPSPQGIDDNGRERRDRARGGRTNDRPMTANREVRTYDGTNNNIDNPSWGATFEHLQRLGPVAYSDGISSLAGENRPSARVISNDVLDQPEGTSLPNPYRTTDMVWQWGQFIDHDLDLTDGGEESVPIIVPTGDAWFDPDSTGTQTIAFARALFDPNSGSSVDAPREQENEITSWIDGSMVYGSEDDRAAALRVGDDSPFLATSDGNLLPFNVDGLTNANGFAAAEGLFLAGDIRVNEQLGLATMHTLWMREHNRIAQSLMDQNFSDDAEVVFQQARRLVIAKIQKITYDEYLPALHGPDPLPAYDGYDATINPTIFNEFSVAAYRFGHSLLNEQILRVGADGLEVADGHVDLKDAFFTAPSLLVDDVSIDPVLRGLATQLHQTRDHLMIDDIRNFLFGQPGDGGLDLPSLNVQRGRDHGVPSYNDMREVMGLGRYTDFSQITSDGVLQASLSDTYGDIDDIDLWVGGLAEDNIGSSQFGPLFDAIILKQFENVRDGDRFWYERDLTPQELQRIENVTLATVIRDNTSIGDELQDDVFRAP